MSSFSQPVLDQLFRYYDIGGYYDEMFDKQGEPRPHYSKFYGELAAMTQGQFEERRQAAEFSYLLHGISYTVHGDGRGIERAIPFDLVPRIVPRSQWDHIERGLTQRVLALNAFLCDVYGRQRILDDQRIPRSLVYSSRHFRSEMVGVAVPNGVHTHISGIDLIRDSATGEYVVLEDNVRTPSGISYVIENRAVMNHSFPRAFQTHDVLPVDDYPAHLLQVLGSASPRPANDPSIVLLTPGIYSNAYFEHTFLAQQMGIELVEGRDLVVDQDIVYMKTIRGLTRVDVIYRRIDDEYLDSLAFRPESLLGVPGLMGAYKAGNVALANAVGNGVAGDKAIYAYVPEFIRYYLGEEPLLPNIETWQCSRPDHLSYVLDNLNRLVVKAVGESGGYGMMMGPFASRTTLQEFRQRLKADPRNYVAQPVVALSRCPSYDPHGGSMAGRHVDLRPYCLFNGNKVVIVPGALTRVALKPGSMVVNSSLGGGNKDTWILRGED